MLHDQATECNGVVRVAAAGQQRVVVVHVCRAGWAEEFGLVRIGAGVLAVRNILVDLHRVRATELSFWWAETQCLTVPRTRSGTLLAGQTAPERIRLLGNGPAGLLCSLHAGSNGPTRICWAGPAGVCLCCPGGQYTGPGLQMSLAGIAPGQRTTRR